MQRFEFQTSHYRESNPPQSNYFGSRSSDLNMYNHPHSKMYPPGSNPRLAGIHAGAPPASNPGYPGDPRYNRIPPGNYQQGQPYYPGGMMMGYQGAPPRAMLQQQPSFIGQGIPPIPNHMPRGVGYFGAGYGSVGDPSGTGGGRYHPYMNSNLPMQPPPRAGFLEQLLKNRGANPPSYQSYGRTPLIRGPVPNIPSHGYSGGQPLPYRNGSLNQGVPQNPGGRVGGYFPQQSCETVWNRQGGGPPPNIGHNNGGQGNFQNPFQQRQSVRNNMPVIKNEPEDNNAEELAHDEIKKSGTRFRKNHERMKAILDEKMVNCDPPTISMQRITSLQQYVKLLQEDVKKHKKETVAVKEHCEKSLQEFHVSSSKFNDKIDALSQPIGDKEYNDMVDKFYKEMKNAMLEKKEIGLNGLEDSNHNTLVSSNNRIDSCCNEKDTPGEVVVNYNNNSLELTNRPLHMTEAVPLQNHDLYFENAIFEEIPPEDLPVHNPQFIERAMEMYPVASGNGVHSYGMVGPQIDQGYFNPERPNLERSRTRSHYRGLANGGNQGGNHHMMPQRWQENYGTNYPQEHHFEGGYQRGPTTRRPRPTDELREFLMGLVGNYREDNYSLPNQPNPLPQLTPQPELEEPGPLGVPEDNPSQRRFLNSGGIVEVRPSAPPPAEPIFDVTREWINSLSCPAGEPAGIQDDQPDRELPVEFDNENLLEDFGSSMEEQVVASMPTLEIEVETDRSGKDSKLAEILESPCLNDNSPGEFESQMKQLEDALNENVDSTKDLDGMDGSADDADQEVAAICQNQAN